MNRFDRFIHHVMGWHFSKYWVDATLDGLTMHTRCSKCGYVGMVDSQGNLF